MSKCLQNGCPIRPLLSRAVIGKLMLLGQTPFYCNLITFLFTISIFFFLQLPPPNPSALDPIPTVGVLIDKIDNFSYGNYKRIITILMASTFKENRAIAFTPDHARLARDQCSQLKITDDDDFAALQVEACNINRCLEILSWRFKTFLPVAKPTSYFLSTPAAPSCENEQKMMNRFHAHFQKIRCMGEDELKQALNYVKQHPQMHSYELRIKMEKFKYRLIDLALLPLPQILYLLKEMMIGYEVLVDIFGIIEPSDAMIVVNEQDQWKVWISNILQSNQGSIVSISQKEFIYKLILIAEKHCVVNSLSRALFAQIKELTYRQECSFIKVMEKINDFSNANKVFQANKVVCLKEEGEKTPFKTLNKKKGYTRIEQMNSSFIDGVFVPKQTLSLYSISNESISSNPKENSEALSQISPQRKQFSKWSTNTCNNIRDQTLNDQMHHWRTQDCFEFYTPKEKINNPNIQVYSPQIEPESKNFIKPLKSAFMSPRLNCTTALSKIEQRRRSEQVNYFHHKYRAANEIDEAVELHPSQQLKRQVAYKNLNEKMSKQQIEEEDPKNTQVNSYVNSISTEQMKESTQIDKNHSTYKNLNDFDFKYRNNQSSYMKLSVPRNQKNDKNLSVSYEFRTKTQLLFNQNEHASAMEAPKKQWKNTISGLFSDTSTIKQLKTSIKIKTPHEQRKYLSDINLELLGKMGRTARESMVDEGDDSIEESKEQSNEQDYFNLIDTQTLLKSTHALKISRDSQEEQVLSKPTHNKDHPCTFIFKTKQTSSIIVDYQK